LTVRSVRFDEAFVTVLGALRARVAVAAAFLIEARFFGVLPNDAGLVKERTSRKAKNRAHGGKSVISLSDPNQSLHSNIARLRA
jgi:hypothetical protein